MKKISLIVIVVVAITIRVWYILQPDLPWWDAAIYIGMGKYIFTQGTLGVWEIFRPLLWPLVMGSFWKLGLNAYFLGQVLEVIFAAGSIILVYLIGEKIKPYAGLIAALFLSVSSTFFESTIIPIVDIPTMFLAILAVYLILKDKYFWGGVAVSVAFVTRFPAALILIPIALYVTYYAIRQKDFWGFVKKGVFITLGFATLAVPNFIANYIMYDGDILLPIKQGGAFATNVPDFLIHHFFWYFTEYFINNVFIIFALLALVLFFVRYKEIKDNKAFILTFICFIIVGGYWSKTPHKELRYGLAFMPFLLLLAAYGIVWLKDKISKKWLTTSIVIVMVGFYIGSHVYLLKTYSGQFNDLGPLKDFYAFFDDKPGAKVITTSPMIIASSDSTISEIIESWENANDAYERHKDNPEIDYMAINTCSLSCKTPGSTCDLAKEVLITNLDKTRTKSFAGQVGVCALSIYKLR